MKTEHLSKVKDTLLAENNLFKVHEPNDENNFPSDCLPPVLGDYFEELADKYDISQDLACPLGTRGNLILLGQGVLSEHLSSRPNFWTAVHDYRYSAGHREVRSAEENA